MEIQLALIKACKEKAKDNLANELADLLSINLDAAYRRIRGVTPMTIDEIALICRHYKISFDAVMSYQSALVPFQFNAMFKDKFHILEYLTSIRDELMFASQGKDSRMAITAMDIPYFRQFGHKSLRRFKLFFWQRSVLNLESYRHKKFEAEESIDDFEEIVENIHYYYHGIKSYEIWAPETLESTIRQIQYYLESGLFVSNLDAVKICDDLHNLLDILEKEAETGQKRITSSKGILSSPFEMYQSDIFISNNCIQAYVGNTTFTHITFNTFNHLMTFSPEFSEECRLWVEQMRSKAILLSEVSEKLRYQFFLSMRKRVDQLRNDASSVR